MLTNNKQKEKVHKEKYQLSRTDPRKSGSMISSTLKEKSEFNNKIKSAQVNIYVEINKLRE